MDYRGHCQSEAIFGSSSRCDSDRLSDKDYLIVDNRPEVRRVRRLELEQMGWSVASYSWSRLASLARQKALFVQHLKLEALVVKDDAGRLRDVLDCYFPKSEYEAEVNQAGVLIESAISGEMQRGITNWIFDVIAVNLRNLAILALANRGEYVFSYNDAMARLAVVFNLPGFDAHQLLKLREIKAKYRDGCYYAVLPQWEVEQILSSTLRCVEYLGCSFVDIIGTSDFLLHTDVKDLYFRSRLIERDVLRSVPTRKSDVEEYQYLSKRILLKIKRPRDYLWKFEHDHETVQEVIGLRKIAEPLGLLHRHLQTAKCNFDAHAQLSPGTNAASGLVLTP